MTNKAPAQVERNVIDLTVTKLDTTDIEVVVTFDNAITLRELYKPFAFTDHNGQVPYTVSDVVEMLSLDNNLTLKYRVVRKLGTCVESAMVEQQPETEPKPVVIDGMEMPATESFWSELGNALLRGVEHSVLEDNIERNRPFEAIQYASELCSTRGLTGAKELMNLLKWTRWNSEAAKLCAAIVYSSIGSYVAVMTRFNETPSHKLALEAFSVGDDNLPNVAGSDGESEVYKLAEKIATGVANGKLDYEQRDKLYGELSELLEKSEEEPELGALVQASYAMVLTCSEGSLDTATEYLKHVKSKDNASAKAAAERVLDAIEDGSLVEEIPMCSKLYDDYDKDIEKDMIKTLKADEGGLSEEEEGKVEFGVAKQYERTLDEGEEKLVPYDYYCLALIFDVLEDTEYFKKAVDKGLELTKDCTVDNLHFKALKSED